MIIRITITGPPGAGKGILLDELFKMFGEAYGYDKVAFSSADERADGEYQCTLDVGSEGYRPLDNRQ